MSRIRIATFDALQPGGPDAPAEQAGDGTETAVIFGGARDPIHARLHRLAAGATIGWSAGVAGHLAYVWEGAVRIGATRLPQGSMVAVEHGGVARLVAEAEGASVLVFNRPVSAPAPTRAGGHVHVLPADRVPRTERMNDRTNYGAAIFADSACPTCALWLHESRFFDPDFLVVPHYHSEDEIIVVTAGEIVLGQRRYGRGTAIAVAKDTVYSFRTGPEGLDFINFRPSRPTYATPGESRMIDEQALYAEKLGRPRYLENV